MSCCVKKTCAEQEETTECKMKKIISELPPQQRIKALALFQLHTQKLKSDEVMEKEIQVIEQKYFDLQQPLYQQQQQIISGERAPQSNELENLDQVLNESEKQQKEQLINDQKASRIDNYWVKVFENCEILCEEMRQKDKPVLKFLNKINLEKSAGSEDFKFIFEFSQNDYFDNLTLTKKFFMKDAQTPIKSEGTEIQWKDGKDLTKKKIQKKQKNKKTGQTRVIEKIEQDESFFNFFASIDVTEDALNAIDDDEEADKQQDQMDNDLEIAQILDDEAIPYSIEHYLGIAKNDDSDMNDDESDDDDDDSDSESEEDVKDKKKKRKGSDKKGDDKDEAKPDCKQQ